MRGVFALLALAPWTAECVWGGFTAASFLPVVVILAPQYGGAAVLIREVARRTGGGWPSIVLLAAAFGFVQAGLVDQSLYNPGFLDSTEFAADAVTARATWIPGLDFSAQQAVAYVGGHIALSICAPIAVVESFAPPGRRHEPWLGGPGLAVMAVVYLLGSALIFRDVYSDEHFLASPLQAGFTLVVVLALIGVALRPRRSPDRAGRPRGPLAVAVVAAAANLLDAPGWAGVAVKALGAAVAATLVVRWSHRPGWNQRHVLAGWGAGLIVAAASAYAVPDYAPASPAEALVGDVAISVITVALLGAAWLRLNSLDRAGRAGLRVHVRIGVRAGTCRRRTDRTPLIATMTEASATTAGQAPHVQAAPARLPKTDDPA